MPERRLPMRQIREVLRLHHEAHLSERQIAHGCRLSRSTVQRYLERATTANLRWPLPESLDDTQLEQLLFPSRPAQAASEGRQAPKAQPDFTKVHQELKANRSVTLQLLWQEFMEEHPDGVHYSCYVVAIFMLPRNAGPQALCFSTSPTATLIDRLPGL